MSTANLNSVPSDRLDELVAGFVIGDLSTSEESELQSFDPDQVAKAVERTEIAAVRTFLSMEEGRENLIEMPIDLKSRLLHSVPSSLSVSLSNDRVPSDGIQLRELASWFAAVAATAIALAAWLPSWKRFDDSSNVAIQIEAPTIAQKRDALLSTSGAIKVDWSKADGSGESLGDIVWSSERQEGYMRFTRLAKNDPTVEQYQLWIVDPERDSKPVDGGVFDVNAEGEVIVPVNAKLSIGKPTLFAITVEKPGGVVVSDQSRLPLLAKVVY